MNSQIKQMVSPVPDTKAVPEIKLEQRGEDSFADHLLKVETIELSAAQQRLWFLEQINPGASTYHIAKAIRIKGKLNCEVLQRALDEVVRRHESLRTSFPVLATREGVDGKPMQVIAESGPVALSLIDLAHLSPDERESEVLQEVKQAAARPFDLTCLPLFRVTLVRQAQEDHILTITMHHIISDGSSVDIFLRELCLLYEAFIEGKPSALAPLKMQYADYAAWQRQWMESEALHQQLKYWKQKLEGAPPVIELAADRARPAVRSYKGGSERVSLSLRVSERLKQMSRDEGVTMYMSLLGVYEVMLMRNSGQEEVVIGTAITKRGRAEEEALIGMMVNTVVVRGDLRGDPTVREVMRRVREEVVEMYENQDVGYERVVEELRPERVLSHNPLFQVWFVLQNAPARPLDMGGLKLKSMRLNRAETRHDLQLSLWESPEGLRGSLEYSADLFNSGTIKRMARSFERLLEYAVAHPDARVSALMKMLDDADGQQQVIKEKQIEESALRRFKTTRRKAIGGS
jgi:hypothetical protein